MFCFYKHTETIEYVKKEPTFYEKYKDTRLNNYRILRTKKVTFSGYYFYLNTTYGETFKSALVYL